VERGSIRAPMRGRAARRSMDGMLTETAPAPPSPRTAPRADAPAIRARGLRVAYGDVEAVRGIDLDVPRGAILALLGPNGAGKTSTVEVLEGFRDPAGGTLEVLGCEPRRGGRAWRDRLGIVLQETAPELDLTVRECLRLYAGYYSAPRDLDEVLGLVGLQEAAATRTDRLSGGQRRRLDVALALVGDPELIFLDEPTTGFDPAARRQAWEVVGGLRALGRTILLPTHYMEEAERLADRIVVMARGRVVAEGTPATLGGRDRAAAVVAFSLPPGATPPPLGEPDERGRVVLRSRHVPADLAALAAWALADGIPLADLTVRRPTLEDIYLELTR